MQVYMKKRVKSVTAIGQIHERMSLWGNSSLRYISLLSSNSSPLNHLFFLATFISEFFLLWASCCWDTWSPLLLLRALLWANSSLSTACLRCLHSRAVLQCVEPQVVGIPQGLSPHPQQSLEQPCRTIVKKIEKVKHILCAANSIHVAIFSGIPATEVTHGRAISWTIFRAAIAMQQAPIAVPHSAAAPTNRRVPLLSWTLPHTRGTHGPSVSNPGSHKTCNNDSSIALDCFHPPTAATFHKSTDNLWIWLAN